MSEAKLTLSEESKRSREGTRDRIIRAAASLLAESGREAVSTRAVAEAAGVQAPTIYRKFGDMRGLLDEVVSFGFSAYSSEKIKPGSMEDPVEELRRGWDMHVGFGLDNPALYKLMYGDPVPGSEPTAATEAFSMLRSLVHRIAEAGRLRVAEKRATSMIHAAAMGTTLTLIGMKPEDRDLSLSRTTREAVLASVTMDESDAQTNSKLDRARSANHAVSLRAMLPEVETDLTPGERALLSEWLDKLS
jgi:AcrR family transcriptional regulator